jgi:hypothetical protein
MRSVAHREMRDEVLTRRALEEMRNYLFSAEFGAKRTIFSVS